MNDPDFADEFGAIVRAYAEQHFSLQSAASAFEAVLIIAVSES